MRGTNQKRAAKGAGTRPSVALLAVLGAVLAGLLGPVATPLVAGATPVTRAAGAHEHDGDGDGGETYLADALREGTPGELRARKAELSQRLEDAGSKRELAKKIEAEAAASLAALDAELNANQLELLEHREQAKKAEADLSSAKTKKAESAAEAEKADADLRAAAVDMFINPPEADGMRAALTGAVEDALASSSLLAGRAEMNRQIAERRDRALAAAAKAEEAAAEAAKKAEQAQKRVEQASADIQRRLEERNLELLGIREDLALLEEQVAGLQLTDSILAGRLALDEVARNGSVTTSRDATGNLVPDTSGLPQRSDMVLIPNTSAWVHHLIAPAAIEMFAAAERDGVPLNGGGYRDPVRQIELRMQHCGSSRYAVYEMPSSSCSPPTARPGRSMHERGLAIDFSENGSALTRSSAGFKWLSQNAAKYGFYNLPSEPWHWSVNGH